jgi:hypothetical protein
MQAILAHFWCQSGNFYKVLCVKMLMVNNLKFKYIKWWFILNLKLDYEDICVNIFLMNSLSNNGLLKKKNMDSSIG